MIVEMTKVRVLAPRERLYDVLFALQDVGQLHLTRVPSRPGVEPLPVGEREAQQVRRMRDALVDVDSALEILGLVPRILSPSRASSTQDLAHHVRFARRARREVTRRGERVHALEEERAMLEKYRALLSVYAPLLRRVAGSENLVAHQVVLRPGAGRETVEDLRAGLSAWLGDGFELMARPLPSGEQALLILVPSAAAGRVEALLADAALEEVRLPSAYATRGAADALTSMAARLEVLPGEIVDARGAVESLAESYANRLQAARAAIADRLAELEALAVVGTTDHVAVIEGWIPSDAVRKMTLELGRRFEGAVNTETVAREEWQREDAPVVLHNPRLLRPFELLIRLVPLPKYGSIDPTPFVAVFFPMLFGIILGDVGYGLILAGLGLVVHRRSRPDTPLRAASEVAGAGALFAIIFGVLFGEFFGDAGRRLFGFHALVMDREEALLPFLGLAVALGFVHVLIGLVLGAVSSIRTHPRHGWGRGVSAVLIVLIAAAVLAAVDVLPGALFTPVMIGILVAFPVLVILEGVIAPIELLSAIGHILSYARVMAVGTASVMMAVVANRMTGLFGSVLVGALFGLIFHLVNLALGLFSPTIHALRLHYVEFFGTFYSPGGTHYRPFRHGSPGLDPAA